MSDEAREAFNRTFKDRHGQLPSLTIDYDSMCFHFFKAGQESRDELLRECEDIMQRMKFYAELLILPDKSGTFYPHQGKSDIKDCECLLTKLQAEIGEK